MDVCHVTSGAPTGLLIARDRIDRGAAARFLVAYSGALLLAWCIMPTHIHGLIEATENVARELTSRLLEAYARWFNARHKGKEKLFHDKVGVFPCPDEGAVFTKLDYVHQNPVRSNLTRLGVEYVSSSAREYAALSLGETVNLKRGLELLGERAWTAIDPIPPLADLDPGRFPAARPELLLAASAEAFGLTPEDLVDDGRAAAVLNARACFLKLGKLETYGVESLAPLIRYKPSFAYELAKRPVPDRGLRIARTLIRTPALRPILDSPEGMLPLDTPRRIAKTKASAPEA
jgi:REP element-mobilizing transposase RayT